MTCWAMTLGYLKVYYNKQKNSLVQWARVLRFIVPVLVKCGIGGIPISSPNPISFYAKFNETKCGEKMVEENKGKEIAWLSQMLSSSNL